MIDMIYDYISLNRNNKTPLYVQLYTNIKNNIENGNLQSHCKLPSIRKLSDDLNISKTTVENAYSQLCAEGYIINKPQSGFYTADLMLKSQIGNNSTEKISKKNNTKIYRYDFTGRSVDTDDISLKLWKKYIRYIINCDYLITSYGDPQGEPQLRRALSEYSYSVRGVTADSDEIIIGAGTQPLLYLLCGLLRENYGNTIAVENQGFSYAEKVFNDCNFKIEKMDNGTDNIDTDSLENLKAKIFLVNPSGNLQSGKALKVNKRTALLNWAEKNNCIIIEDDYNGELKYSAKPIPAMQGFNKNRVVYIGSFSKLLVPSVRIGYMTLPQQLLNKYIENKIKYNQTASKMEQLALAKYISDGQMERNLRRLRKIYKDKSEFLINLLNKTFGKKIALALKETSLSVSITFSEIKDISVIKDILSNKSVNVIFNETSKNSFDISFSGIKKDKIQEGIDIIYNAVSDTCK